MKLALEQCSHDTLIWLDFAGLKLTNDIEHFKKNFSKLKKYEKIIIPGGFRKKELLTDDNLFKQICWRFLGTIAIFPRNLVEKFNDEQNIELILGGLSIIIEHLEYDEISRQHGMPFPVNLNAWTTIKNMIIKIKYNDIK